tara:strand:+ start:512 stop:682 length:171 start_codon:yes stop_codon:yes gene_type:complete
VLVLDLQVAVVVLVILLIMVEQQALLIPEVVVVEDHIPDPDQLADQVVVDLLWFDI